MLLLYKFNFLSWKSQLYHRIEINQKSDSLSAPLKLMSLRMSPRTSHRCHQQAILASSPSSFDRRHFRILVQNVSKTSAFITGKCSFKVLKCQGNLPGWHQYGVLMAYFRTCTLMKWGQVFTRVGLLVNLFSVAMGTKLCD